MCNGAELIATERYRQVACEGFDVEHDDVHVHGSLGAASQVYIEAARRQVLGADAGEVANVSCYWPWDRDRLKVSTDPIRNLVKAGALIAAEIDRLQRSAEKKAETA